LPIYGLAIADWDWRLPIGDFEGRSGNWAAFFTYGLDTSLPQPVDHSPPPDAPARSLVLEYRADGSLAINNQPVALQDLQARLTELFRDRHDKTLFVDGDGHLPYGRIVEAIDLAKGAGVVRVGVITPGMRVGR
jgi:biopolymer transport protein ExbD